MSQLNVDTIKNRVGTGGPTLQALTVTNDATVGGALTVTGNFTVNGTTTTIDTVNLVVEDANIGIASTSAASNTTADGAGITIFGGTDGNKTWTWERDTGCFEYSDPSKFKGVVETVAAATTFMSGSTMILEMDVRNATTYTYTNVGGNIGIVSFKNMPADSGVQNGTTITLLHTQNASTPVAIGNTTESLGIGTNITICGYEDGAKLAGISTRGLVGSGTTITFSSTARDRDFVSFFIHYNGGGNTTAASYQVYVTENGNFRQGAIGV